MNTKEQICNLSLGRLGTYGNVDNIDSPQTPHEKIFAKWYDVDVDFVLKLVSPNFALERRSVSLLSSSPAFGPTYSYEYPSDCLRVLGIGEIQEKENNYSVEGNAIITDEDYPDGMPIRFIKKVTDVSKFTPDFIMLLSWQLAYDTCISITKDYDKLNNIEKRMPSRLSIVSSLNGMENRPIRINNSKMKQARTSFNPSNYNKR